MEGLFNGKAGFWIRVLRDIGFPIFVAVFLLAQIVPTLVRFEVMLTRILIVQQAILDCVSRTDANRAGCGRGP